MTKTLKIFSPKLIVHIFIDCFEDFDKTSHNIVKQWKTQTQTTFKGSSRYILKIKGFFKALKTIF